MPEGPAAVPGSPVRPSSIDELARLLREARGGPGLSPWGAGSQWARWGREPAARLDLSAIPAEPRLSAANLTVVVPAWWRLDRLDAMLAPHDLWYPVDTGDGGATTVGGHVAAATAGIRRTGLGPARDWVLGMRALLPDGREVRPGGQMIKNVAGYNVHRVLVGSLGTLAVLVEVSLRIAPRPERHVTLRARFESPAAAWAALSPLRRAASTLVAAEWLRAGPGVEVLLAFEGPSRAVVHQSGLAAVALRRAPELATGAGDVVELLEGEAAAALWEARRARLFGPASLRLRAGVRPSELPQIWAGADEVFAGRAWDGIARGYGGVLEIVIPAGREVIAGRGAGEPGAPAGLAPAVRELRRRAEALGGYLQIRGARPGFAPDVPWTAPSPDGDLHRRLKAVFDPDGVLVGAGFLLPEPGEPGPAGRDVGTAGAKGGSAGGRV